MAQFVKCGENLVKHVGGGIYLSAKILGKKIRRSLQTNDLRVAKLKRDQLLNTMRKAATSKVTARNIGEAIAVIEAAVLPQADLEAATIRYYGEIFRIMRETLPCDALCSNLSVSTARDWWGKIHRKYAAQRANNVLGMAKRMGKWLEEKGIVTDDPFRALRRVKIKETAIPAVSVEDIDRIVANIRSQNKANSEEAANVVAFLAFSGCRHGQVKALEWKDVEDGWIVFRSGVPGTKGAKTRRLPMNVRLQSVVQRQRELAMLREMTSGKVFLLKKPNTALSNACKRLGFDHLRLHDLRHFFASWGMECGIDATTLAAWLGHKDGGRLLLARYAHLRDTHSAASAAKLL